MKQMSYKTQILNRIRSQLMRPSVENWLSRWTSDRDLNGLIAKLVPNHYQYSRVSIRNIERHNLRWELDLSDLIEWSVFFDFTDPALENFLNLVKPGSTVIDVGANIGNFLMRSSQKVGVQGQVIGFEPQPNLYNKCRKHVEINNLKNTQVLCSALSDKAGKLSMTIPDLHNSGTSRIVTSKNPNLKLTEVDVLTLDRAALDLQLNTIDVIKVDSEGHELHILNGAREVIEKFRPVLFLEADNANLTQQGSSVDSLFQFLIDRNYKLYDGHLDAPLDLKKSFNDCHFDLLAMP